LLEIRWRPNCCAALVLFAFAGVALQGCEHKPEQVQSQTRLFASDFQGGAKTCVAAKPTLAAGKDISANMQVGNDGGWCGITVAQDGQPYDAGLLTQAPEHGKVYIHPVGDATRIDYTPDPGYSGADAFVVTLLPGDPVLRVNATVAPH
jgi:hypothetical protein